MGGRNPRYANGARRRALAARMRAAGGSCWICGLAIDCGLPAGDPLAFELDELVPVSKGGSPTDPANVAPAHRCCNQWRSNRSVSAVERIRAEARARGGWRDPRAFCEAARSVAKGKRGGTPVRHPKRSSGAV